MDTGTISEPAFLLTELRYTIGQVYVQTEGLDSAARKAVHYEGRDVDQILSAMVDGEAGYRNQYSHLLKVSVPGAPDNPSSSLEADFEGERLATVALLDGVAEPWTPQLLDIVRQQIAEDRLHATQLAECRKAHLERDRGPNGSEPPPSPG